MESGGPDRLGRVEAVHGHADEVEVLDGHLPDEEPFARVPRAPRTVLAAVTAAALCIGLAAGVLGHDRYEERSESRQARDAVALSIAAVRLLPTNTDVLSSHPGNFRALAILENRSPGALTVNRIRVLDQPGLAVIRQPRRTGYEVEAGERANVPLAIRYDCRSTLEPVVVEVTATPASGRTRTERVTYSDAQTVATDLVNGCPVSSDDTALSVSLTIFGLEDTGRRQGRLRLQLGARVEDGGGTSIPSVALAAEGFSMVLRNRLPAAVEVDGLPLTFDVTIRDCAAALNLQEVIIQVLFSNADWSDPRSTTQSAEPALTVALLRFAVRHCT